MEYAFPGGQPPPTSTRISNPPMGFGRWVLFGLIVLLPYTLIGISTWYVYPDGFWITLGCLAMAAGVGAVFTHYSDQATPRIRRHCIVSHFILLVIGCVNLGMHFGLTRELSAAKRSTAERRTDEDRRLVQSKEYTDQAVRFAQAERDRLEAEGKAAQREAWKVDAYRRSGYRVAPPPPKTGPQLPNAFPTPTPEVKAAPGDQPAPLVHLTEEMVMQKWGLALTIWAFVDAIAGILLGGLLWSRWEWDRNHDGIADGLQTQLGNV